MNTAMYRFTTALALVALLLGGVGAAQAQERTISETVDLDRDGRVTLNTFSGSITITTWDEASAQIEARIAGDDSELVDLTEVRIAGGGGRLDIETDYDEVEDSQKFLGLFNFGDTDKPDVHYTLTIPRTAALTIEDFSSDIEVTGLAADLELKTFSSPVTLRDITGHLRGETFSGDVEIENLRGSIDFETFSGSVTVRMNTLEDDCSFKSFSGDVALTLPADAAFDLDAELGMGGDLDSAFTVDAPRSEDGDVRGAVGGGGPRLSFETFSGTLELRELQGVASGE